MAPESGIPYIQDAESRRDIVKSFSSYNRCATSLTNGGITKTGTRTGFGQTRKGLFGVGIMLLPLRDLLRQQPERIVPHPLVHPVYDTAHPVQTGFALVLEDGRVFPVGVHVLVAGAVVDPAVALGEVIVTETTGRLAAPNVFLFVEELGRVRAAPRCVDRLRHDRLVDEEFGVDERPEAGLLHLGLDMAVQAELLQLRRVGPVRAHLFEVARHPADDGVGGDGLPGEGVLRHGVGGAERPDHDLVKELFPLLPDLDKGLEGLVVRQKPAGGVAELAPRIAGLFIRLFKNHPGQRGVGHVVDEEHENHTLRED